MKCQSKESIKQEMAKTIKTFQAPNAAFEIRFLKSNIKGIYSGKFTPDERGLESLINELDKYSLWNYSTYMTVNKIREDIIDNDELNQLVKYAKSTTKDKNISHYNFIHVDFDPVREVNTQATKEEKAKAKEKCTEVIEFLRQNGFKEPIISFSGNGYNADYRVNYENSKENAKMTHDLLVTLSNIYSDDNVSIDTTTSSPGQIIKLYGCPSVKGEDTAERPYSYSKILRVPKKIEVTEPFVIQKLLDAHNSSKQSSAVKKSTVNKSAKTAKSEKEEKTDNNKSNNKIKSCDDFEDNVKKFELVKMWHLEEQLDKNGIDYKIKDEDDRTHYILYDCPFNEHDNHYCSYVTQFKNDKNVLFHCFHDHCQDFNIEGFAEMFDLEYQPLFDNESYTGIAINEVLSKYDLIKSSRDNKPYLRRDTNPIVAIALDRKQFSQEVLTIMQSKGISVSKATITTVRENVENIICNKGETIEIAQRIAFYNNRVYYSISNKLTYYISSTKIAPIKSRKVAFVFEPSFSDQVKPDFNYKSTDLPALLQGVFSIDQTSQLIFYAHLLCMFIPNIDVPIMVLNGKQGSGKSTMAKMIKSLVDPSKSQLATMDSDHESIGITIEQNYLVVFDNVDSISQNVSDLLCLSCTGGEIVRRERFSDKNTVVTNLRGRIIITGIKDMIKRADLSERCNVFYLQPRRYKSSSIGLLEKFESVKPKLLGSIFDCLHKALKYYPKMQKLKNLPRMADFAIYGASVIKAMGLDEKEFLDSYNQYVNQSVTTCDENYSFFSLIVKFLKNHGKKWSGTPTALFESLKTFASSHRNDSYTFTNPASLSKHLKNNSSELLLYGIIYKSHKGITRSIELILDNNQGSADSSDLADMDNTE